MTNTMHAGMVLVMLALGLAGCDRQSPGAPGDRRPPPSGGLTLPPVATMISGAVYDTAHRPLAGAAVEVLDGPESGTSAIADVTGDFVYARLQTGSDEVETCYAPKALDGWADRVRCWAAGKVPDDLPRADPARKTAETPRDVFVYFIHSGKVRAPHGAMALMERVTA